MRLNISRVIIQFVTHGCKLCLSACLPACSCVYCLSFYLSLHLMIEIFVQYVLFLYSVVSRRESEIGGRHELVFRKWYVNVRVHKFPSVSFVTAMPVGVSQRGFHYALHVQACFRRFSTDNSISYCLRISFPVFLFLCLDHPKIYYLYTRTRNRKKLRYGC